MRFYGALSLPRFAYLTNEFSYIWQLLLEKHKVPPSTTYKYKDGLYLTSTLHRHAASLYLKHNAIIVVRASIPKNFSMRASERTQTQNNDI